MVPTPPLTSTVSAPAVTPRNATASAVMLNVPAPVLIVPKVTAFALMVRLPPAVVMVSPVFILKSPVPSLSESAVNVTELPAVCARFRLLSVRSAIVILFVASKIILVVAAIPSNSDSYNVNGSLVAAVSACNIEPIVLLPPVSMNEVFEASSSSSLSLVPSRISISVGSRSNVPVSPLTAVVSTLLTKLPAKDFLPDISTKPPSPDSLPPLALISP